MTKRQSIRKAIIIGMALTFPVTIAWLSPAMPIIYGFYGGIIVGATIIFLLSFLCALFLGRVFCGFVCPCGGLSECLMQINNKKIKNNKLRAVKYFIWVFLVIATIISFICAGGINKIDFFAGLEDGWIFLSAPYRYAIYFSVLLGLLSLQLTQGKRSFCQCFCWMAPFMIIGTKISDLLRLPRLRLKVANSDCTGCKQCTKRCTMSLDVMDMVKAGKMANSECILCGECVDVCPKKSISYIFESKRTSRKK